MCCINMSGADENHPSRSTQWRRRKAKRLKLLCQDPNCTAHSSSWNCVHFGRDTDDAGESDSSESGQEVEDDVPWINTPSDLVFDADSPSQSSGVHHIYEDNLLRTHSNNSILVSEEEVPPSLIGSSGQSEEESLDNGLQHSTSDEALLDTSDESCEDLTMHFLNEVPNQPMPQPPDHPGDGQLENLRNYNHPGNDPDDPDDPAPSDSSDDNDSEEDDEEGETFSFEDVRMNTPLQFGHAGCTLREGILLNLTPAIKYHWTYEALADSMASWSTGLGRRGIIPETKKQLWSLIKKSNAGITKYAYCPNCLAGLGKLSSLQDGMIHCREEGCNNRTHKSKLPFFLSLSLRKQFEKFLSTPGMAHYLQYRGRRRHREHNAMEDIFDGDVYRNLVQNGTITDNDLTYIMNTDGFRLFKHRSMSVWGLLLRLNELPPNIRQKHMFLAGIWIGNRDPRMNTFLAPFVSQANRLSAHGVQWQPDGVNDVTSKIIPIGLSVDAPARAKCMNQHQYNGEYGCYCCTHQGIFLENCIKFPLLPFQDLPPAIERTHQTIEDAMNLNRFHEGQIGPSQLWLLNHFDLAAGQCMDDLHPFYEGVAAFFSELLIQQLRNQAQTLATINFRMRLVRTPIQMSRKWMSIHKRDSWKGSQWSYFIRYHAVLCYLENSMSIRNLEHLSMLSYALFVFSQDSINHDDFQRASEYCERFVVLFQDYYGPENMRFNIHMLTHVAQARRRWGSAWTTSTFNFESWNRQLGLHVTSAKGAADQIVLRHFLKMYVHSSAYRNDLSERVKDHISDVLFSTQRKLAEEINNKIYVLGRGKERPATAQEQNVLRREGIACRNLTVYERMLVRGIEYRTRQYHQDTRSDNSNVFTWDNRYLSIENIFVVVKEDGDKVCLVFSDVHLVDYPIAYAHHIGHVLRSEEGVIVRPETFRVPLIKMLIREETYLVPMANCIEID